MHRDAVLKLLRAHTAGLAAVAATFVAVAASGTSATPEDRVGLPADYAKKFEVVRRFNGVTRSKAATVYVNELAATVKVATKLPYPYGSVLVVAWAEPVKDAKGAPVTGPDGLWQPGEVAQIDVMRREPGFGDAYGADRTGEWEFASYQADGSSRLKLPDAIACAQCHRKAEARDFVFRGRFPAQN